MSILLWNTNLAQEIVITRGEGCNVWDVSGKCYLDLLSGAWCNILGHSHPLWTEAVSRQISGLTHVGSSFMTEEIKEALSKLEEILPISLNRAVFLNTGSEAFELALKMAHAATGSKRVIVFKSGYYGATAYALSLSESGREAEYLPHNTEMMRLPAPNCAHCPRGLSYPCRDFECLDVMDALAEQHEGDIAAVVYEPVMAMGGMIVPPVGYGRCLAEFASRSGALLIADEGMTAMGRTGHWFGFMHEEMMPDILVVGKGLGNGLPVSAVVTNDKVESQCQNVLKHVQPHQNDPFSGKIVSTVISILKKEKLVQSVSEKGIYLLRELKKMQSAHPEIFDVRGRGAMIAIELVQETAEAGAGFCQQMFQKGFIIDYQRDNATFRLLPPYIISNTEIDSFLGAFDSTLKA